MAQQTAAAEDASGDSAFEALDRIGAMIRGRQIAVFLDYDGTLTPITALPDQATMPEAMRTVLARLACRCPVAVISGRRRTDVARLVGIDTIAYAGSHGFDIQSSKLGHVEHPQVRSFVPDIKAAAKALEHRIGAIPGVIVEDKIFVVAVHYRLVDPADMPAIADAMEEVARDHPRLKRTEGKRVHELRPRLDWDKGKAVLWLFETLPLDRRPFIPLYIGDDVTDEDAFAALADRGICILVAEQPRPTGAHFRLRNPEEVCLFLDRLGQLLERGAA